VNALTKLFVVLLVVCSLLLSAAVVVFVNKQEPLLAQNNALTIEVNNAKLANRDVQDHNKALQATIAAKGESYTNELAQRDTKINGLNVNLTQAALDLANAKNEKSSVQTQVTNLTNTVSAAQQENTKLQADLTAAQQANSTNVVKLRDLNIDVTKLTAENDTLEKQRKYLEEQAVQLKKQVSQVEAVLTRANIKYDRETGTADRDGQEIVGTPGQLIGRISDVRVQAGVRYATITIGSSDNVTKGMRFWVVDGHGEFYGTLMVENVQPTEAFGTLDGPKDKVDQIKTGLAVKTQL